MTIADIVNSWFREHLAGGPLAQSTAAYNQAHEALPVLIERLEAASLVTAVPAKKPKADASQPAAAPGETA